MVCGLDHSCSHPFNIILGIYTVLLEVLGIFVMFVVLWSVGFRSGYFKRKQEERKQRKEEAKKR